MSNTTWDGTRPAPTIPPERAILTDLIAELRDDAQSSRLFGGDLMHGPRVLSRLDRAEQRLREVQGE